MRSSLKACRFVLALGTSFTIWNGGQAAEPEPIVLERKIPLGEVRGRIDHLAADLSRRRVFVAELGNDSVGVVDAKEGRLLQTIRGFKQPQGTGYSRAADTLYVANAGDGSVRVFQGESYAPAGRIELGDDADNVRIDPRSGEVYVGYGNGALARIDPVTQTVKQTVRLKAHPEGFQLDDTGARAFVNLPETHEIALVDLVQAGVSALFPTNEGRSNFPMAFDAAGRRIFVGFRSPARLAAYSATERKELARTDACRDADDVFFDPKRERLYVSCGEGFVDVYGAGDSGLARLAHVATAPGARTSLFVAAWDRLYVAVRKTRSEPAALWVFKPVS